jgi:hypothetical protein
MIHLGLGVEIRELEGLFFLILWKLFVVIQIFYIFLYL